MHAEGPAEATSTFAEVYIMGKKTSTGILIARAKGLEVRRAKSQG